MASLLTVRLAKGDSPSWGFRLQGGKDFGTPLVIQKVIVGSPAERAGLVAGDSVIRVNTSDVFNLRHKDAQDVLLRAGNTFDMTIQRGGSTWKPSVIPTGPISTPSPTINNISPVTRTSLAAKSSENIGAIGTGHNVSAKPFLNGTLNGGPKVVNNQYNTPLKLYSEESIAETLSAQTEVLSTGALGVNFKKNEKNYDASKSAVLSLLKEEESSPRSTDYIDHHHTSSGIDSAPSPVAVAGLRHVIAPENKPQPPSPQLPPGQNICADCERLIVGVFVKIKDKNLHVECFKCSTCGTSLKNVGYYNINNKLYCDIHAKLAARNNPPAPNLVPITVPPGGKAPANAITAALATHPYPTSAPLSPKINNSYQSSISAPKPFGSVPGLLSPSTNFNTLPRTGAPLSPISPVSAPTYSPVAPIVQSVSSIVWPPVEEEPELPSACPLFYPPPSQITIKPKTHQTSESSDYPELEKNTTLDQHYYSEMDELRFASGRRSATECAETISETVERQRLIETIIKNKPQYLPPTISPNIPQSLKHDKTITQQESTRRDITESIGSMSELEETELRRGPSSKIDNPVPKKWESQMLQALTISVDNPRNSAPSPKDSLRGDANVPLEMATVNELKSENTFCNIPPKKTSSALGSALSVAPVEPFNSVKLSILDPVPLPEETVPYFPPENLYDISLKDSETTKPSKRKKDPNLEKLLEDLPKPQTKLSMLAALTTAPERPFTPTSCQIITAEEYATESSEKTMTETTKRTESSMTTATKPIALPQTLKIGEATDPTIQTPSPDSLPLFQGFTCSFQNKTDHSQFDIQISTAPRKRDRKHESDISKTETKSSVDTTSRAETMTTDKSSVILERENKIVERKEKQLIQTRTESKKEQNKNVVFKKPEQMIMLRKPEALPQYQVSVKDNAEADIIMINRMEEAKQKKEQEKRRSELQQLETSSKISQTEQRNNSKNQSQVHLEQKLQSSQQGAMICPVIRVQEGKLPSPENSFKPVVDSRPQSCTFSPRPQPVTPSMVNKPPLLLPYYQANLVAQKYGPPTVNLLDPKSPAMSRSPSPLPPECRRTPQLHSNKSSNIRPTSPAQGPPGNPMQRECVPTIRDFKLKEAKDNVTAFIPHYQEKIEIRDENEMMKTGKDSRNMQRDSMITSGVVTEKREMIPQVHFEGESRVEEIFTTSENQQNYSRKRESKSKQREDAQSAETHSFISGGVESTTKVSEKTHLEKSEDFKKLEDKSIERSADGNVEIKRTKRVTEEMEHTQKSKEILIEKSVTTMGQQGFRNVRNPEEVNPHVMGLHITSPNPIRSPFIKSSLGAAPPKLTTVCQKVGKDVPCPKMEPCDICPKKQPPIVPNFDATTLPQPKCIPEMPKETVKPVKPPPIPVKHVNAPGSSKLDPKLNPNVPPSDVGSGGGRQAGAIGMAPKRGRGVLNTAQMGGRMALCGQCHGQIRGPFISALGKIWCPNHFICATPSCRRPLQDMGFVEEQGQLYCEYCFEQYLAPICAKCGSKIKGDCLKAIGKGFHPECFNCVHCGKLFGNSPFFLEDGSPYCETDWNEFFTTKCFACGFPVEAGDRWVEALNNNYHSQCFNCTMCKKNLEGQSFFAKGGRPYCKNHAR